ncbi:Type II secretion system protein E [Caloramator mitchellensis]|uniref:Type II secretion system protein E n=1 Tax=Caloramator mitchellensis TaxID=908809 RepID=A0A0R3K0L0_CALMK|nr:ATPase, T2SS/T4P/T4SS family [Caloramator mitchellensis]KRQ88077.1 Type II secretion system protein E [Caloramator mitchellensis]
MQIKKRLGEFLVETGLITPEQLQKALMLQKSSGKKLGEILVEQGFITEDQIIEVLEFQLGIPHVKLDRFPIEQDAIKLVSENIAKRHTLLPIKIEHDKLYVAMADPLNIFAIEDVQIYSGKNVQPAIAKSEDIKKQIDKYYGKQEALKAAEEFKKENKFFRLDRNKQSKEQDDSASAPIVKLVNSVFEQAIIQRASDIHIEPFEEEIIIKFRIDGILYEIMKTEVELHAPLVARIKVLGNMDIAEKRIPQDGRTSYNYFDREYDMRISTLPTVYGEKVVIRIADKKAFLKEKKDLGFLKQDLDRYDKIISSPHGIILVSGPTGSGKSTTLYTILRELNTGTKNIITVEDPVESTIKGVNQVEINQKAGLTFATALRSILRQDPDIIMIGEIRDKETAEIAVRAAITGHLVLSTIHTNDAPSAVTRLVDMGIENFLISSSLVGVIAQRLVRKICPHCKEEYVPDEAEVKALGFDASEIDKLYKGKGCVYCGNKGYIGRTGIYEILIVDKNLRNYILKSASSDELKDLALQNGMLTLKQSCAQKVKKGETTFEEFLRVTYSME